MGSALLRAQESNHIARGEAGQLTTGPALTLDLSSKDLSHSLIHSFTRTRNIAQFTVQQRELYSISCDKL